MANTSSLAHAQAVPSFFKSHLIRVVDGVPETRGLGVVFMDFGRLHRLRRADAGEATVVFERRMKPFVIPPMLRKPEKGQTPRYPSPSRQAAAKPRTSQSSPASEWINLGFNCGGAVLAWIGVVGMSSLAPVTGGLSLPGAALIYAGAAASTLQCSVSVVRTVNLHRGRADINNRWDKNSLYVSAMWAADGVSLIGAGGALKELRATKAVLASSGFTFKQAVGSQAISRPMRRKLTAGLALQGARRVPGAEINRVVKQRLLDGTAGVIGLFASGYSGLLNEGGGGFWDMVVWSTEETGK